MSLALTFDVAVSADHTANKALTGLCAANIALFIGMKLFYIWRNKQRQARWDALPASEKISGVDVKYLH